MCSLSTTFLGLSLPNKNRDVNQGFPLLFLLLFCLSMRVAFAGWNFFDIDHPLHAEVNVR